MSFKPNIAEKDYQDYIRSYVMDQEFFVSGRTIGEFADFATTAGMLLSGVPTLMVSGPKFRMRNRQTGELKGGTFDDMAKLDKRLWLPEGAEQWTKRNQPRGPDIRTGQRVLTGSDLKGIKTVRSDAHVRQPGQLGRQVNLSEGLATSRGKGGQGNFLVNETTTQKRARLYKQGIGQKEDRTGFYTDDPGFKEYLGKTGGGFGELRELDVEGYNEFIREQPQRLKGTSLKGTFQKGGQVQRTAEGELQTDDIHFKSALYEAIRRPGVTGTGAELHGIAKKLADGSMTFADLKGTRWSKLRASHKQVLVDGLNFLSGEYQKQDGR